VQAISDLPPDFWDSAWSLIDAVVSDVVSLVTLLLPL
jgi:hypothetical protein